MNNSDDRKFDEELTAMLAIYGLSNPSDAVKRRWWNDLIQYPLQIVLNAFAQHERNSVYQPRPANIIDIIKSQDGRPDVGEAWNITLTTLDESESVIWTEEIAMARSTIMPMVEINDMIGARMAFKECYSKAVSNARDRLIPCRWSVSLGHDSEKREHIVEQAIQLGYISAEHGRHSLPAPEMEGEGKAIAKLLTGKTIKLNLSDESKERLERVRSIVEAAEKKKEEQQIQESLDRETRRKEFEEHRKLELEKLQSKIEEG